MGRSSSQNRRYVRKPSAAFGGHPGSAMRGDAAEASRPAARTASLAGLTDRPTVEQLERRQMLFALTVTADDVDPATGIGTVRAYFGYALPYLTRAAPAEPSDPTTTVNTFNDSTPGPIGSGVFLQNSPVLIRHTIAPAANLTISPGAADVEERYIRAVPGAGQSITFEFFNEGDNPLQQSVEAASFFISGDGADASGIDTNGTTVELLFNDQVIATFTGATLRALIAGGNPNAGIGTFTFGAAQAPSGFDAIRLTFNQYSLGGDPAFRLDNLSFTRTPPRFVETLNAEFGAVATLTGPVGASAQFLDLYGREMVQTIGIGIPEGSDRLIIDPNDNGVPDFNDGIGSIRLRGTDFRSAFTLFGGTIEATDTPPDGADFFDGQFAFTIVDNVQGFYSDFESAGFGYAAELEDDARVVVGLPEGPGSVIVGSPYVRPQNNYNAGNLPAGQGAIVTTGFVRADQGIFVEDGASIASVNIHGVVHGSSRFSGSAGQIAFGYMVGSVTVEGDLGSMISGTDAGLWSPDPGFVLTDPNLDIDPINKTAGQLIVGRTVGEIAIAGRSLLDVTVVGDLNSPTTRPPRDSFTYDEREVSYGTLTTVAQIEIIRQTIDANAFSNRRAADLFRAGGQAVAFGTTFFRNDAILSAEYVGSASTGVRIRGELSGIDPINTGEDKADVYAFAVDGSGEVVIEGTSGAGGGLYLRIVDADGRTVAAPRLPGSSVADANNTFLSSTLRFRPEAPGVYYLVLTDPSGAAETGVGNASYTVLITGMAATTLGAYRTGAGSGFTDVGTGEGNSVTVLSGSVGSIRIGTGFVGSTGGEVSPAEIINTVQTEDDVMSFQGGTFVVPGTLYNITAGSDIGTPGQAGNGSQIDVRVGGDLGSIITGLSRVVGTGVGEGDLNFISLTIGGRIGLIDVRGGIGMDQDSVNPRALIGSFVPIVTGTAGGRGDIGLIRVGFHVGGDSLSVVTSPGSTIGGVLVSQDSYNEAPADEQGVYFGQRGLPITTGAGSDVRFVDLIRRDESATVNATIPIRGDDPTFLIDDGGARVIITVLGAPNGVEVGQIIVLPIDGSQGVAIGQISVDLTGGRTLRIESQSIGGGGVVGIGRIVITGSDVASSIDISGIETDVLRIEHRSATAFGTVNNRSLNGDIVAADFNSLLSLTVTGNLGSTQVNDWGPDRISPFLGIQVGLSNTVNTPLGLPVTLNNRRLLDTSFNGQINRTIYNDDVADGTGFLDDIGSPFDGYLDGLVVRSGGVAEVRADGSIGDVILQDGTALGVLTLVTANADRVTLLGGFDGIVGTIFALDIGRAEVGDGLAGLGQTSFARAGIVAMDDIGSVGTQNRGPVTIAGNINAANANAVDNTLLEGLADGVGSVDLPAGSRLSGADVNAFQLDSFWDSFLYGDDNVGLGNIGTVRLRDGTLFRSQVRGNDVGDVDVSGGVIDASQISALSDVGTITARAFANSTLQGSTNELAQSLILVGQDLGRITVTEDFADTAVDVLGSITQGVTARTITRATFNVDNEFRGLTIAQDIRASNFIVGQIAAISVGRSIQSSEITASGRLSATVGDRIVNTVFEVTGPDGRIESVTAATLISGAFRSAGTIGTIAVTAGDLVASVTTTGVRGDVASLSAGRDLDVSANISGSVGSLVAGRDIGRASDPGVIVVRGDLGSAAAPAGQLHADLRVGGRITAVTVGGASNKPGADFVGRGSIIAFGPIAAVVINGDFDGDITSYTGGIASVTINQGSLLPGNTISAFDGDIGSIVITNGNLLGSVFAGYDLKRLSVTGSADGVFGHVGVNPDSSPSAFYSAFRNQLPPGVSQDAAIQGPRIAAGFNVVAVDVSGWVFEGGVVAGRSIQSLVVGRGIANDRVSRGFGSYLVAGDTIDSVLVSGVIENAHILAGVTDLGMDGRPGGVGAAADTVKSGMIALVSSGSGSRDLRIAAGINAGSDGLYNTGDDSTAFGLSRIENLVLPGVGANVSVFSDALSASVANDARIVRGGTVLRNANALVVADGGPAGEGFGGTRTFDVGGSSITIAFSGPGQAFFDAGNRTLTLRFTTSATSVTASSSNGTLENFRIVTNDDASLGTLRLQGRLVGDSDVVVDGGVGTLDMGDWIGASSTAYSGVPAPNDGVSTIAIGDNLGAATFASFTGGYLSARAISSLNVRFDYGSPNAQTFGEVGIQALSGGTFTFGLAVRGAVSVDRDLGSFTASGIIDRAALRVGGSLGTFTAGNVLRQSVIAVADRLTAATIAGEMFDAAIIAGLDTGTNAAFGGSGAAADRVSSGFIGTVTVGGNFRESDITAGYTRGPDGFFGTSDDIVAAGRSSIGSVRIAGTQVGSTRSSETYRIASTGTLGPVTVGGQAVAGAIGNFRTELAEVDPVGIQVTDIRVSVDARVFSANIVFNQDVDASTIGRALGVSEVRGTGDVAIRLIEGTDYTVRYVAASNTAVVTFSRSVTDRNLPQTPGLPGPGVFRFELDQDFLRGRLTGALVDGDGDGFTEPGDDFSLDVAVGDAGDKLVAETVTSGSSRADLYAPFNLNFVLDGNASADGLPDPNSTYTLRGFIGDHPDNDTNFFRFSGDVDLYSVTLQAGQILRLGALQGSAIRAPVQLLNPDGTPVSSAAANADVVSLPAPIGEENAVTFGSDYLIKRTGTYVLSVGFNGLIATPGIVNNPDPIPGSVGDYAFTIAVFDDGDSGFSAPSDAGDGRLIVDAPAAAAFTGPDGTFGTPDDPRDVFSGAYRFTLNVGADGVAGTGDDVVTGGDGQGIVSVRTADGVRTSTISAAIGPAGHSGIPEDIAADVDVFHLNGRNPIAPGTRMRLTVKLSLLGADLGGADPVTFQDSRGSVQFGLFDTTASVGVDDAVIVFSPTDFSANGGTPNTVIADNGQTRYGYDANGDFYIDFATPERQGGSGAGTFAAYIQGVRNTDYQLEVVTGGVAAIPGRVRQNVFIETGGGSIDWLEIRGVTTLTPYQSTVLGFTGSIPGGLGVNEYILQQLVTSLNTLFRAGDTIGGQGFDVVFSTNPADFEFQPFSTVFLTNASDPIQAAFDPFSGFNFGAFFENVFFNTQPYGYSEHSDPFNADLEDEAAVFAPSFGAQGLTPSISDVNEYVNSLTAAVSRRVGELMGLRLTDVITTGATGQPTVFDPFAGNSPDFRPGTGETYAIPGIARGLSNPFDAIDRTNFFLGRQNAASLLDKVLNRTTGG